MMRCRHRVTFLVDKHEDGRSAMLFNALFTEGKAFHRRA